MSPLLFRSRRAVDVAGESKPESILAVIVLVLVLEVLIVLVVPLVLLVLVIQVGSQLRLTASHSVKHKYTLTYTQCAYMCSCVL